MIAVGVDIGGSHISCMAIDFETQDIIEHSQTKQSIKNTIQASDVIDAWCEAIQLTIHKSGNKQLAGIGIAMPGPFDYEMGICKIFSLAKLDSLFGLNVRKAISNQLNLNSNIPVNFINDAFAFGIGEAWRGKGIGAKRVVAITLGTGFGSAFLSEGVPVVKGEIVPDDGFIYHVPFKKSIADDYISTRWFVNKYKALRGVEINGVRELSLLAETDKEVLGLFEEFGENMAEILIPWLLKFEAEVLIIGGNITGAKDMFLPVLNKSLKNAGVEINVQVSDLKEKAAFIGCARLSDEEFYTRLKHNIYAKA